MRIEIIKPLLLFYFRNKKIKDQGSQIDMSKVKNILLVSNTAIGDTLFATSSIRLIKKHYPDKKIILLIKENFSKLFDNNPNISEVLYFSGKWGQFIKAISILRKKEIDLTFLMNSNEPQATPLAYFAGSKFIIRTPNNNNEFKNMHHNHIFKRDFNRHTIHSRLEQLKYIGIDEQDYQMYLYPEDSWYFRSRKLLDSENFIYFGFQTCASTLSRMWRKDRWVKLAMKILNSNEKYKVILLGSNLDKKYNDSIFNQVNHDRIQNFSGIFDISETAGLIDSINILISVDTGPLHIAGALKTPTVAISVAGKSISSNPIDKIIPHVFIEKPETCKPCIDKRCKDAFCMEQISVEEVFFESISILESKKDEH